MSETGTPRPPFGNSPEPGAPLKRRWPTVSRLNVLRIMSALSIGCAIYMLVDAAVPTLQERAVCDRVVSMLLKTREVVELNRAVALTGFLKCNVSRRMPAPE